MFEGEFAGLDAIYQTGKILVPKPLKAFSYGKTYCLAMEHKEIGSLENGTLLGEQLADLHLDNINLIRNKQKNSFVGSENSDREPETRFGFPVRTSCGFIPQNNQFTKTWEEFFARKIDDQLAIIEREYHDMKPRQLWNQFLPKISSYFEGQEILPSLLHGDLWGGNAGECSSGPIVFDPAAFYGHHEYDLAIATMFGGFPSSVFKAYHKKIPKERGFENRQQLYQLFHYLNHWSHFGGGYKSSCMSILKSL
ncbi:DgyrCDS12126 [Dimorphilus gyrociliatus]|uniref:protein-ribulosamine 3-kinase n=1 Tax=Dimorphilus gyrociliatus TaxID=2664684 RepID=A0A7I8W6K6_9ANNE|nr:DgyrCDS12126 [Dimorphilus gyrociliatus]